MVRNVLLHEALGLDQTFCLQPFNLVMDGFLIGTSMVAELSLRLRVIKAMEFTNGALLILQTLDLTPNGGN